MTRFDWICTGCWLAAILTLSIFGIWQSGYRRGQIHAQLGKIKFDLVKNQKNGETRWHYKP